MSLTERIDSDIKTAMKEKNELALSTLRMLKAAIKNKEIDKKTKGIIDFTITVVDHLILTKRGKFKMFLSELEE